MDRGEFPPFSGCLILVSPSIRDLQEEGDRLQALGMARLSIGRELSRVLLGVPPAERAQRASDWLPERVRAYSPAPLLCSEIDLLFHPDLNIDPLMLFRQSARFGDLAVLWPGAISDGWLSYAVPAHRHYNHWYIPTQPPDPPLTIRSLELPKEGNVHVLS